MTAVSTDPFFGGNPTRGPSGGGSGVISGHSGAVFEEHDSGYVFDNPEWDGGVNSGHGEVFITTDF